MCKHVVSNTFTLSSLFPFHSFRVSQCTDMLPKHKPIYCMGVGYAEDLVVCVALGVDMFDCVYPTRTAVGHYNALPLFTLVFILSSLIP